MKFRLNSYLWVKTSGTLLAASIKYASQSALQLVKGLFTKIQSVVQEGLFVNYKDTIGRNS